MKPRWIVAAEKYIGTTEIVGKLHNSKVLGFWQRIKLKVTDDETPWCSAFVSAVLEECGIQSTRKPNARSYLSWGQKLDYPLMGCIVVLHRGDPKGWQGHVGFVVGQAENGDLAVLGGNQGNAVSVAIFPRSRVLGYQFPFNEPRTSRELLLVKNINQSKSEA